MSRRRRWRGQSAEKAAPSNMGQTLMGAVADANMRQFPYNDAFWFLYKTHPWVRACVTMIAEAVGNEGFGIAKADGVDHSPLTADDDERVESTFKWFSVIFVGGTFRDVMIATAIDMEVFGRAFWRRIRKGKLLVGLERIDVRLVVPKFDADRKKIVSYAIKKDACDINGITVANGGFSEIIDAEEMVHFKRPGGDVLLGAGSPLESLNWTLAMDLNVRRHRNSYFANGAPAGTVLINKGAKEDQVRAAVKQVKERAGSQFAYLPLVLTGEWEAVNMMQSGKQEVDFVKGTGISREEVCAVYAFPLGKLLYSEGALGSSGKGEDDNTFQNDCVLPLEELMYETITTEVLRKEFTDYEDLAMVPKRRNRLRLERVQDAVSMAKCFATGNEIRQVVGLPPISDPKFAMDVPIVVGVTGQGFSSDEALADGGQQAANGETADQIDASASGKKKIDRNEVGQKAASRFPAWY